MEQTIFLELAETIAPIPTESFRSRNYDQLMLIANTKTDLPGLF